MKPVDLILGVLVLALVLGIVYRQVKKKKGGCSGCSQGCGTGKSFVPEDALKPYKKD